jgi:hypothetical protein
MNPELQFTITISNEFVQVDHPERSTERIKWLEIEEIKLLNTDDGPFLPDVWLCLIGANSRCLIPQGSDGYDEVYEIVSKYEGFSFENVIKSMACTDNAEFRLWKKLEQ